MGSVGDSSLGDVHVAILTPYFGTAPEDGEVGAIVRKAVEELGNLGARVSEIAPEGFDALLQGHERHQRGVQVQPARLPREASAARSPCDRSTRS